MQLLPTANKIVFYILQSRLFPYAEKITIDHSIGISTQ